MKLKQFVFGLFPFLRKFLKIHKRSLKEFSVHYNFSFGDRYTGKRSEVSLKDMIEFRTDLKKKKKWRKKVF